MDINLKLPPNQAAKLDEYYSAEAARLTAELQSINGILSQLRNLNGHSAQEETGTVTTTGNEQWNNEWSYRTKIIAIMKAAGKPLSTADIANAIMERQPDTYDRIKLVASISSTVTNSNASKLFMKVVNPNGGFLYALVK